MTVASPFAEGQLLAGKYRVERVLGQGGMGVVLAARHIHLEERVAIKLMLAEAAFSPEAVARFVREARAAARLESAHVAKVSDVGTLEDGRPYMVMEYLDGADLSHVLASSGPLAVSDAVDYLLQAGEAIAEAHSLGIVHRDLKPANLFLTRRRDRTPHVKVLDFGISKVAAAGSEQSMTRTSAMMGSPLYMSPEQMTSVRDVDGRSDIWALGIILFELLTGSPPFVGETLPQVCGLVIQTEPPLASSRRPDLSPEMDAIIGRCLAKDPGQRFQSVAELAQALQPFASRYGRSSAERITLLAGGGEVPSLPQPPIEQVAKAVTAQIPGTHAAWGDTRPPAAAPAAGKGWLAALGAGVLVLGAAAWWFAAPHADAVPIAASASGAPIVDLPPAPALASTPASAPSAASEPAPAPSAVASAASSVAAASPNAVSRPAVGGRPNTNPMKSAAPVSSPPKQQSPVAAVPTPVPAAAAAKASVEPKKPAPSLGGRL